MIIERKKSNIKFLIFGKHIFGCPAHVIMRLTESNNNNNYRVSTNHAEHERQVTQQDLN